LLKINQNILHI